jgi:hypothetical protein
MSIAVDLERVRAEAERRGAGAFLLSVTDDGRPHVVAVTVGWDAGAPTMTGGRTSVRNATHRPGVTLLWPPDDPGGYSLILDGEATAEPDAAGDGGNISIEVTRAVLHRPASGVAPGGSGCGSDCVPLERPRR